MYTSPWLRYTDCILQQYEKWISISLISTFLLIFFRSKKKFVQFLSYHSSVDLLIVEPSVLKQTPFSYSLDSVPHLKAVGLQLNLISGLWKSIPWNYLNWNENRTNCKISLKRIQIPNVFLSFILIEFCADDFLQQK